MNLADQDNWTDEQQTRFGQCLQTKGGHHWHDFGTRRVGRGQFEARRKCCGCQAEEVTMYETCQVCHGEGKVKK